MLRPLSLFIGLRYTLARRRNRSVSFISAIAMVGIILGVALLITVLSVMNGFDRELRQRILSIVPQVTLYHRDGLQDWPDWREQVLQTEGVAAATPFVELQAMLHSKGQTRPALIYGLDDEFEATVSIIDQYLKPATLQALNADSELIALGSGLAEALELTLGDAVTLILPRRDSEGGQRAAAQVRRVKVADIFATGTELDHSLSLLGLASAAELTTKQGASGLHLRVDDLFAAPAVASVLRSQLPFGFYINDWTRTHGNIYTAIRMSKNLVSLLLFLIIAIAAFNVVSTLVMVVVDKQGDIAILRTLGMTEREVMTTFVVQGTLIGVLGTLLGALLGVLLSLTVADMVAALERVFAIQFLQSDIYPVSFLPAALQAGDVVLVTTVSLLMSLLATLYPARKAARVQPAEALRYD